MENCTSPDAAKLGFYNWTLLTGLSEFWKDECIIINYSQKNILLLIDYVKQLLTNMISQLIILITLTMPQY